jgi:hypothetical protein
LPDEQASERVGQERQRSLLLSANGAVRVCIPLPQSNGGDRYPEEKSEKITYADHQWFVHDSSVCKVVWAWEIILAMYQTLVVDTTKHAGRASERASVAGKTALPVKIRVVVIAMPVGIVGIGLDFLGGVGFGLDFLVYPFETGLAQSVGNDIRAAVATRTDFICKVIHSLSPLSMH